MCLKWSCCGTTCIRYEHWCLNYKEIDIPAAKQGEWTTFTTPLSKLGLQANDVVAMIGVALENTDANYQMNIGELALRNPEQSFATIQPKIKEIV